MKSENINRNLFRRLLTGEIDALNRYLQLIAEVPREVSGLSGLPRAIEPLEYDECPPLDDRCALGNHFLTRVHNDT